MKCRMALVLAIAALVASVAQGAAGQSTPAGELVIATHVTLAPTWFDPGEPPAQITPFAILMECMMFAPIFDLRALMGVGPRVAEHTINSIPVYPFQPMKT